MDSENLIDYLHEDLNEEITGIGGHYVITQEMRLPYEGEELLYLTGYSVMDTSCCGNGGCGFALVYGIINGWKTGENDEGKSITRLRPVRGELTQKAIRRLVMQREVVNQVNFR